VLDAGTGRPVWSVRVGEHETAVISSSPLVFEGNVYVGVANGEEAKAANPSGRVLLAFGL